MLLSHAQGSLGTILRSSGQIQETYNLVILLLFFMIEKYSISQFFTAGYAPN